MKKFLVCLFVMVCFVGCNSKNKELEKLQIENEKTKLEIQKLEKERLLQTFKRQYKIAEMDIQSIGWFIESYITDWSKLPDESSLEMMSFNKKIVPFYIKNIPIYDPWGNKYVFQKVPNTKDEYIIYSLGSDGMFKGLDQSTDNEWEIGTDIIWKNGEFTLGLTKLTKEEIEKKQKATTAMEQLAKEFSERQRKK